MLSSESDPGLSTANGHQKARLPEPCICSWVAYGRGDMYKYSRQVHTVGAASQEHVMYSRFRGRKKGPAVSFSCCIECFQSADVCHCSAIRHAKVCRCRCRSIMYDSPVWAELGPRCRTSRLALLSGSCLPCISAADGLRGSHSRVCLSSCRALHLSAPVAQEC